MIIVTDIWSASYQKTTEQLQHLIQNQVGVRPEQSWMQKKPKAVREFIDKLAALAASPYCAKFLAVIKSAASAASLHS